MDASAAMLAPTGEPEIARGSAPFDALWDAVDDRRQAVQEAEAGGWHAVAAPLAARAGEPPRWLLLATASRASSSCSAARSSDPRRSRSSTSRCWPMHETAASRSEIPR
jgi:hypothetical protein